MDWFNRFHRLEYDGVPLYIDSQMPDWFVPSSRTDALLRVLQEQTNVSAAVSLFAKEYEESPESVGRDYDLLKNLLRADPPTDYQGRFHHLQLGPLKEIWFHLTDKCNLSCRHCLFGSSPAQSDAIGPAQLYSAIDQARGMGCHLFYFTGGEPFVYPDFTDVLSYVLDGDPAAHVVVLTNGLLLQEYFDQLAALDHGRLHLQVSLDGLVDSHDYLRGRGAFVRLRENLAAACDAGLAITVSVAVNAGNVDQLPDIARTAKEMGAAGLHLMYHFVRGKGTDAQFVRPEKIFERILETVEVCRELDLQIDNLEAMKSQIFSIPGTRHDLSNMGWESVAVGPDGVLYPSPALVRIPELACGSLADGLEQVWLQNEMLEKIRRTSQVDAENRQESPFHFLNGGGDPDHSWVAGKSLVGHDPYMALYDRLLLWLVTRQATHYPDQGLFRLRMGDVRHDCPESDENGHKGQVSLTHCNCVISLADHDGHSSVKEFYGSAALQANEDIVNPFGPTDESTEFIPEVSRTRSYGCGSPVKDAKPQKGETVVDLGSGSGIECFLAASDVGAEGRVFGIDMTDDMLALARSSKEDVVRELGFDNIEFRKGYLENIPLEESFADAVISNCVINLSPDKRQTYLEIFRVLKPGGRLVVSDIVTDEQVEASIRNSVRYRGECLGGAMRQDDLVQMLIDCGFEAVMLHKRYPYRQLGDNRFFSLTYEARKPAAAHEDTFVKAVYRGPHRFLETGRGTRMDCGRITLLTAAEAARCDDSVFLLDDEGVVTNVEQEPCTCGIAPGEAGKKQENRGKKRAVPIRRHSSGCMVCGAELQYDNEPRECACHFCGAVEIVNSCCSSGHFICDSCHQQEGLEVIRHICLTSREKDMITLVETIRSHPAVPMHGPEHHGMVPGVILVAYRNSGGDIRRETIGVGIDRGSNVPGGACGFWGSCGAAIGAGIAAALILDATPLTPNPRQQAQEFTAIILAGIAEIKGGRCCQRETWLALTETARLSSKFLGVQLQADTMIHCSQYKQNRECIRKQCPLWEARAGNTADTMIPLTMAR